MVDEVIETLLVDGVTAERVQVPFEFQPGATEMLRVSDVTGYDGR